MSATHRARPRAKEVIEKRCGFNLRRGHGSRCRTFLRGCVTLFLRGLAEQVNAKNCLRGCQAGGLNARNCLRGCARIVFAGRGLAEQVNAKNCLRGCGTLFFARGAGRAGNAKNCLRGCGQLFLRAGGWSAPLNLPERASQSLSQPECEAVGGKACGRLKVSSLYQQNICIP